MRILAGFMLVCVAAECAAVEPGADDYRIRSPQALGCRSPFKAQPDGEIPEGCRLFKQGDTFRFTWGSPAEQDGVRGYVDGGEHILWFRNADVEPIDPTIPGPAAPECKNGEPGTGGEVDRLEEDSHGRLYRKRYMIITKCVKGRWRQWAKRLN